MKAGIKIFGQAGVESIYKEMRQFHDREVVKLLRPCDVTYDIKRRALGYLIFLRMKSNGEIKARECADGRPQRVYKSKEKNSSPTVAVESIFITSAMEANEERDVAIVDVPGDFLQTKESDDTIIKLQGVIILSLLKINPDRKQYVF